MKLISLIPVLALAGSFAGQAAIVEFTDRTAFLAALTSGHVTTDFSSLAAGDQGTSSITAISTPGITVVIESRDLADAFAGDPLWVSGGGDITHGLGTATTFTDQLRISSPGGLLGIGAEWFLGDFDDNYLAGSVVLTFSDGSVFSVTSTTQENSFRGFVSDSPLAFLRVASADPDNVAGWVTVDNLTVPEPSSALLGGIAAMAALSLRRRQHSL